MRVVRFGSVIGWGLLGTRYVFCLFLVHPLLTLSPSFFGFSEGNQGTPELNFTLVKVPVEPVPDPPAVIICGKPQAPFPIISIVLQALYLQEVSIKTAR